MGSPPFWGSGSRHRNGNGCGHHNHGYTMWMAGGGVRGGFAHDATDDIVPS